MSTNPSKPVLIIGSGLGGLTLAHGLQRHSIPFILYERDSSAYSRRQGYRIRIHEAGLTALNACLPEDVYKGFEDTAALNPVAGFLSFGAFDARTGEKNPGDFGPRRAPPAPLNAARPPNSPGSLPVDRQVMRTALLRGLPEPIYEKNFRSYTITPTGVIAHFADGTSSSEGSLLVGADGIYSHVAQQLIGAACTPRDTGARMIYGKTPLIEGLEEKLHPAMNQGLFIAIDKDNEGGQLNLFLEIMRFKHEGAPQNYIYWVLGAYPEALGVTAEELSKMSVEEAVALSKHVSREWNPLIKPVLEYQAAEQSAVLNMTTSHPTSLPVWPTEARVTVLGDAIHQMPPTGGSGANTALQGAALLVKYLSEGGGEAGWTKETIEGYENSLRGFAQEIVKRSYGAAVKSFGVKPLPDVTI
ncbi:2-polyprenyl-6-methoxyphenol hydroxylase [Schizopora paradoxa]|uniref:2-polyprenyl-6-methoxyphenol hydroxylase n=1 Tax=Schizopora paradoxa TaxID=27342 RepID=A0A0H2RXE7_9AGAM|nr:2-polyprenyl-6-methoxyphenol hydroxylase [Schizopora paradoxa]